MTSKADTTTAEPGGPGLLGLIVPSSNTVLEEEMRHALGTSWSVLAARVGTGRALAVDLLTDMASEAEQEALKLAQASPDVLVYGCTSGSFFGGDAHDRHIAQRISAAGGGLPVITASTAAVRVLEAFDVRRLGFYTPYEEEMHQRGRRYFAEHGFDIVDDGCLGLADNSAIAQVRGDDLLELIGSVEGEHLDGIFVSCTGLRTVPIYKELAAALGMPVVTSNTAMAAEVRRLAKTFAS